MEELNPSDYTVAWIAPLEIEARAAMGMLENPHNGCFPVGRGDDYIFRAGDIAGHNIIIASLPPGTPYGTGSAGALAGQVKKFFPNLWFGLLVGVAAGLPTQKAEQQKAESRDIRLGDVLVGLPEGDTAGLVSYDLGKDREDGFQPLRGGYALAMTETIVRSAISNIKLTWPNEGKLFLPYYEKIEKVEHPKGTFEDPGQENDHLYTDSGEVRRQERENSKRTRVWYGPIGSGKKLLKNAKSRDELRDKYGLIGLEMEAAGTMNTIPVGVVRGVCDYGDKHKHKEWQPYATAMAAAFAKAILKQIRPKENTREKALSAAKNDRFHVPFYLTGLPVTGHFVDRNTEMQEMEQSLLPTKSRHGQKVHILHGMGGIGKTQLAIAYARKHQKTYSTIVWVNGNGRDTVLQSLAAFARRAGVSIVLDPRASVAHQAPDMEAEAEAALRWLALERNHWWLVIFDNVDQDVTAEEGDAQAYEVTSFLPPADHGSILITSRLPSLGELGKPTEVGRLSLEQALELLSDRSGLQASSAGITKLVERLGYLPLALVQAGRYMRETKTSCSKYLELYEKSWSRLVGETPRLRDYKNGSIQTTWTISYERMRQIDGTAATFLQLWAYLDHQDVWYELISRGSKSCRECKWLQEMAESEIHFKRVMKALLAYSLVESHQHSESYSVHPVVHDWCTETISHGQDRLIMAAVTIVGTATPDHSEAEYWLLQQRLLPHADRCIKRIEDSDMLKRIESVGSRDAFHNLGLLYADQGKLVEAEKMYRRALDGYEKAWGPDHTSTLTTVNNLGVLYKDQGKLVEAEKMYRRALDGREKAWGPDHISTLDTVNNLGNLYKDQGKLVEAEKMYRRALDGYKKAWGSDHPITRLIARNLALLCEKGSASRKGTFHKWLRKLKK